jgi:hypoxanthine phosphoribosyltransferase
MIPAIVDHRTIYDRILITAEQLDVCIKTLAQRITQAYDPSDNLLALVLLDGARVFADNLFSKLPFPIAAEYLKISSYQGGIKSTGEIILNLPAPLCNNIRGKDVLIIDDIYDTWLTLYSAAEHVRQCHAKSVKTCILLEKQIPHQKNIGLDFLGFPVEDVFVIGYGMDYQNQYRDLPFVAALSCE